MKRVTLQEIAERLNLSVTTVSKALKDYSDVSPKTKAKVKELADELNYTPNSFAVNLRTNESRTIGLIIPAVVHHFFGNVIRGILKQAEKKGYLVIILQSNESMKLEKEQVNLLLQKGVDGILISLSNSTTDFSHLHKVQAYGKPLVLFDKIEKTLNCSKVIIDDRLAGYKATEHLIKNGRKKIAHFRGPKLPQNSIDRYLGYRSALKDYGMDYDDSLVYLCECNENSFEEGQKNAYKLLKEHPDVDGIFINTDLVAIGAMTAIKELDKTIPEDIAVVGFSNWFMSSVITPSLSTIDQPGYEMGKQAFKILFKEIKNLKNGKSIEHITKVLDTALITRKSSTTS